MLFYLYWCYLSPQGCILCFYTYTLQVKNSLGDMGSMEDNIRKEELSFAYVHALCSVAGVSFDDPRRDINSIDVKLSMDGHSVGHRLKDIYLNVQMKCTKNLEFQDGQASFLLKKKNYNDLVADTHVTKILVVLHVPDDVNKRCFLDYENKHLVLKNCAYWACIRGEETLHDQESKVIYIREANLLTSEELVRLIKLSADDRWEDF